jgi:hypothetical protein
MPGWMGVSTYNGEKRGEKICIQKTKTKKPCD